MSVIEESSKLLKNKCDDDVLLNYIYENHDELNGYEFHEPKKHKRNFCIDCNLEKLIDYERSILVCTKCGVFEYYPVYVSSYNHSMKPSRRKCIYKRSDNFKVILNQFLCIQNRKVPDEVIRTLWNQINNFIFRWVILQSSSSVRQDSVSIVPTQKCYNNGSRCRFGVITKGR